MVFGRVLGFENDFDIEEEARFLISNDRGLFVALNATYLSYAVLIGATVILIMVLGLYTSDNFNINSNKQSEYVPSKYDQAFHHEEHIRQKRGADFNGRSNFDTIITNPDFLVGKLRKK